MYVEPTEWDRNIVRWENMELFLQMYFAGQICDYLI